MNIQYEIINFDPTNGSIEIKYFCNEVSYPLIYSIDIPIENNEYPSQETMNNLIEMMKPVGQFQRLVQIRNVTAPDWLMQFITLPSVIDVDTTQPIIEDADELPQ
jgi:hypothetical protein